MLLTDSSGHVIGTPSAPNGTADGFTALRLGDELLRG